MYIYVYIYIKCNINVTHKLFKHFLNEIFNSLLITRLLDSTII